MSLTLEQKKNRKAGIGGSDAACILGLSKWSTPLDIFFDKISEEVEEDITTPNQEWGSLLEPLIVKKFESTTGYKVIQQEEAFGVKNDTPLNHPEHKFMLANIDGYIPEINAILEVKTADKSIAFKWSNESEDDIPEEYLIQCAHYVKVLEQHDIKTAYVAVLIGGNDFRIYKYTRNKELEKVIVKKEMQFWNENVLNKIPPQPMTTDDCLKLWPNSIQNTKIADLDCEEIFYKIKAIKGELTEKEKELKSLQTILFDYMKDSEVLEDTSGDKLCTWKTQTTERFDTKSFKDALPDLFEKYKKKSESRVLRLTK